MLDPYKQYRENAVKTSCPEELVVLMFRGLERYMKQGQLFIDEKDYEKTNAILLKAQDIVAELMVSLDMDIGMSKELYSLYDYILECLRESNVNKETTGLKEALPIVTSLREAWEGALISVRKIKYGK